MGAQESRSFYANSNGTEIEKFCSDQCSNRTVTAFVALDCSESIDCEENGIYRNCICETLNITRWAIGLRFDFLAIDCSSKQNNKSRQSDFVFLSPEHMVYIFF